MRPKRELQLLSEPFGRRTSEVITVVQSVLDPSTCDYVESPRDPSVQTCYDHRSSIYSRVTESVLTFPFFFPRVVFPPFVILSLEEI